MTTMNSILVVFMSLTTVLIYGFTNVKEMVECIRIDCSKIYHYPTGELNKVMSEMEKQNYINKPSSRIIRAVSRSMSSVENSIECWKHLIECNLEKTQTLMAIDLLERFGRLSIPEPGTAHYENFIVVIVAG